MEKGKIYQTPTWVRRTGEKGSGLWPTQDTYQGGTRSNQQYEKASHMIRPQDQVKHENWPTPMQSDTFTANMKSTQQNQGSLHSVTLAQKVNWPTPTTPRPHDNENTVGKYYPSQNQKDLIFAVNQYPTPSASMMKMQDMEQAKYAGNDPKRPKYKDAYPTPTSRDWKDGTSIGNAPANHLLGRAVEPTKTNGSLDPEFVEYLMGYPKGWTDLKDLGMQLFLK
jgi:hypothetical protein